MKTEMMIAYVQCLLMAASPWDRTINQATVDRLMRIEAYLILRYNRD
jgi:hypothetical protein